MKRASQRVIALSVAMSLGGTAFAQSPTPTPAREGEDAAARLLYESGAEALASGQYQTALDRFQQAYDLSRRPGLLYNIGTTLDRLRRDRDALRAFRQFLAEVPEHPRRAEVEARAAALQIAVDEQDRAAAEAEARREEERRAAEAARLEAERRAEEERIAREAAERAAAEASDGLPPAIVYSIGGAAIASGVVGLVFGLRTNTLNDEYIDAATSAPDNDVITGDELADVRSRRDSAKTSQRIANIGFFSAAALAAAAGTLAIFTDWDGESSSDEEQAVVFAPVVMATPHGGHVGIIGRF